MYDNLREKINNAHDTAVGNTRPAADTIHDDICTGSRGMDKNTGVETRPVSASAKTGARTSVSDPIIPEEQAGK